MEQKQLKIGDYVRVGKTVSSFAGRVGYITHFDDCEGHPVVKIDDEWWPFFPNQLERVNWQGEKI